jgi:hypothetical protein
MTVISLSIIALASVTLLLQGVRTYKYGIRPCYINGMKFIPSTDRTAHMVQNLERTHECACTCTHARTHARTHTAVVW